jgi:hypothetical protein
MCHYYSLFTGEDIPLKKPWYHQAIIVFKDPQRPSFEKKSGTNTDGTSAGSGESNPPDHSGPTCAPPFGPPSGSSSGPDAFEAPKYTTSTRRSSGHADIVIECAGQTIGDNVDAKTSEDMLQKRAGKC